MCVPCRGQQYRLFLSLATLCPGGALGSFSSLRVSASMSLQLFSHQILTLLLDFGLRVWFMLFFPHVLALSSHAHFSLFVSTSVISLSSKWTFVSQGWTHQVAWAMVPPGVCANFSAVALTVFAWRPSP